MFLLVNSTTPILPRQPRLVARREVSGGRFLKFGEIESETDWILNIYRRRPVYGSSLTVHSTL
jgi:hypothetical protein